MDVNRLKGYAARVKKEAQGLDRSILARVAGVTFEGRQEVLAKVTPETELMLERDRRNEYDFYAVKVMAYIEDTATWEQAGFVPRPMSRVVSNAMDKGQKFCATVHRLKGGYECEHTGEFLNHGLEIRITPEELQ